MLKKQPEDPVILAAFIYRYCGTLSISDGDHIDTFKNNNSDFEKVQNIIERLKKTAPGNALPYYIEAVFLIEGGDTESASAALALASGKPEFDNYYDFLRKYISRTWEILNFSKYKARLSALGTIPVGSVMMYRRLSRGIVNRAKVSQEEIDHILLFGKRLESRSRTYIEDLVASSIQEDALKKSTRNVRSELKRIELKRKNTREFIDALDRMSEDKSITEERWVEYFDQLYSSSENEAIKTLMEETGY